ncbi:MAG TPA: peptidoglycan DD-metalloendopeptidase family protein [Solimonas sp.]|nr:peptidoglycan DD-metalloendopeptidase family protein [Solimonas sp.]
MFRRALRCLACALIVAAGAAGGDDERLRHNQEALDALRPRIEALQRQIEADQGQSDALAREVQESERRVAQLADKVRKLRSRVDQQSRKVRDIQIEQAESGRALHEHRRQLRRQLRAAYVIGRQGQTQLLLNVDNAQALGRVLVQYDYLHRAQTEAIRTINARASELESLAARVQSELARLQQLREDQESTLGALKQERAKRAEMLAQLRERISDETGELERLRADERGIRRLIESLKETLSDLPPDLPPSDKPFPSLKGKLPWPVRGSLLARYGQPKAGGRLNWNGHWIAASEGSTVRAVARGRVVYTGWMHRYGLIVLVEHDGGYYSLYGHAQTVTVKVGEAIRAGQTIATAGNTGGHEKSGVYFELRKGTDPVDPKLWLGR